MNKKEAIEVLKNIDIGISGNSECKKCIFGDEVHCFRNGKDCQMIAIETVLNLIEKQQAEIEKKDKIIDLMAESIANNNDIEYEVCDDVHETQGDCDGFAREAYKSCKQCIKQYFERKIEQ